MVPVFTTPTSAHIKVGSRFASSCPFTHFNPSRMINMQRRKHSQNPEPLEQKKKKPARYFLISLSQKSFQMVPFQGFRWASSTVLVRRARHRHAAPCVVCVLGLSQLVVLAAARQPPRPTQLGDCVCVCQLPIANCPAMGVIHSMLYSCLWQFCEVLCTHFDSKKGLVHGSQSYTERECVCVCV